MCCRSNGTILLTALIVLMLMVLLITQIYQILMTIEKIIAIDKLQTQESEILRQKSIEMMNRNNWPSACVKKSNHNDNGCVIEGYHYMIERKFPSHCSIINTNGNWYNGAFYNLWVWKEKVETGYFTRFVKADLTSTCYNPWKKLLSSIQSESVQSIKLNITHLAL